MKADEKSAASSASDGSDSTPTTSESTRADAADTTTVAPRVRCNVSGWACEDFGPSLGFKAGRSAQLGQFQIVVTGTGTETEMPATIPLAVLSFLLGERER